MVIPWGGNKSNSLFKACFGIGKNDCPFGLDENGKWCRQLYDGHLTYPLKDKSNPHVLDILEESPEKIQEFLLKVGIANRFPFEKFIINGLFNSSDYWNVKALEWFFNRFPELLNKEDIGIALLTVINSKKQQQLRHKAMKARKMLESKA